jgi:hypothetical protein
VGSGARGSELPGGGGCRRGTSRVGATEVTFGKEQTCTSLAVVGLNRTNLDFLNPYNLVYNSGQSCVSKTNIKISGSSYLTLNAWISSHTRGLVSTMGSGHYRFLIVSD